MIWLLVVLLYAPDIDVPQRMERVFSSERLCRDERDHLARQALPAGMQGRIVVWCEAKKQDTAQRADGIKGGT